MEREKKLEIKMAPFSPYRDKRGSHVNRDPHPEPLKLALDFGLTSAFLS